MTNFKNVTSIEMSIRDIETDIVIMEVKDDAECALNTFLTLALSAVENDGVDDFSLETLYSVVADFNDYNHTFMNYNRCSYYSGQFEIQLIVFKKSRNDYVSLDLLRHFEPCNWFELVITEM